MDRIKNILNNEKNKDLSVVVHIQNRDELDALSIALTECGCTIQFTLSNTTLNLWMEEVAMENDFDTCFRINERREVAYNPSIEHWRIYCGDILELRDGKLVFHERDYTEETARIEAKKILEERDEVGHFVLQNRTIDENDTEEDIVKWLLKM